jgi:hypothetical protein
MLSIRLLTTAQDEARWTAKIADNELGHGTAKLAFRRHRCQRQGKR